MLYIALITLLLTPIAIIAGLIYAYKKPSQIYFSLLIVSLLAGLFVAFKIYERDFMLSFIPDALGVNSIWYREEESWGFGPGGNKAGIRVYPVPEQIAEQIAKHGIEFFKNMLPNKHQSSRDWRGIYDNWLSTGQKS